MYRAIKVSIYPTDEQESYLAQCFGNTRWFWNYMLNATTTAYKKTGNVIKFPGSLGLMKTIFHKELPDAKFTTVTISRNTDGRYYTSIFFNQEDKPVTAINESIGVDLGLKNFAITSDGSKYDVV